MQKSKGLKAFYILNNILMIVVSLIALIPFVLVFMASISDESSILRNGFMLIPEKFSLKAYRIILGINSTIYNGYKISIIVTVLGTVLALAMTSMLAYACSRKHFRYRNIFAMLTYWPMLFSGGMVPFYIVLLNLHLKDNLLGLIIPMALNPFNVFLMLNYFRGLPEALIDSAKIDGASEFTTFARIIMPLAGPVIATVGLFYILSYWNNWYLALLLIDDAKKYPLQFLLRQIMSRIQFAQTGLGQTMTVGSIPDQSVRMATVIVTIGPIVLVYPYIQKYFVKGITIGAVKG